MCCAAVLAFGASLVLMTSGTSLDLRTVPLP